MLDVSELDRIAEQVRIRLGAGVTHDGLLGDLRRDGLDKIDCVRVIHRAIGVPVAEAKLLVHRSPAWADRRDGDEYVEDQFWRALFILGVVGDGQVDKPDAAAAECLHRQQRATAQMQDIAAGLCPDTVDGYRRRLAEGRFGAAFAALVTAGGHQPLPGGFWSALAAVAETLCLTELLDDHEPPTDDSDYVYAAHVVRRHVNTPTDNPSDPHP